MSPHLFSAHVYPNLYPHDLVIQSTLLKILKLQSETGSISSFPDPMAKQSDIYTCVVQ